MGVLDSLFGRNREPNTDKRNHAQRVRDGIQGDARRDGRRVDPEGYSLERNHRAHDPDGWGSGSDEAERSGGSDWTRKRPDSW